MTSPTASLLDRAGLDPARCGPLASDDEVEAFWKRRGLLPPAGRFAAQSR